MVSFALTVAALEEKELVDYCNPIATYLIVGPTEPNVAYFWVAMYRTVLKVTFLCLYSLIAMDYFCCLEGQVRMGWETGP